MSKILKGLPGYFELTRKSEANAPLYVMVNLETTCSYRCKKCALPGYHQNMGHPLSFEERCRALALARAVGVNALVIIGAGEPTEEPNFSRFIQPLLDYAREIGLITILFTTASRLNREQAVFFRDHNVSLYISLDSLNSKTYRYLTGNGDLEQVLANLEMLREVYRDTQETIATTRIVRLGIITTTVCQNVQELETIKGFADLDMHFVANYPIRRGRFQCYKTWDDLVGDAYELLQWRSQEISETGGPTSVAEGVCSYFFRGVSIEVDGQLLICGYAGETGQYLKNIREIETSADLLKHCQFIQALYREFVSLCGGATSPCPLRDNNYPQFVARLVQSPFKIITQNG